MKKRWMALTPLTVLIFSAGVTRAGETKVKMQDLPAAVQLAVKEQSKGATIRGLAKEVENGKTLYEAELSVNGHGKDVTFDSAGKIVSVEEEVAIASIPAAAGAAIQKSAGKAKIVMVESVIEGGKTFYEAHIQQGAKKSEVKVDAQGKPVK